MTENRWAQAETSAEINHLIDENQHAVAFILAREAYNML